MAVRSNAPESVNINETVARMGQTFGYVTVSILHRILTRAELFPIFRTSKIASNNTA